MNVHVFTLALDAMPYITQHLPVFNRLSYPFTWHIIHGAAMNNSSTRWCAKQAPRLSTDGTTDYLKSISSHPCVRIKERVRWVSKDAMVQAALDDIKEECVLIQIDSDEIWQAWQLDKIVRLFDTFRKINCMQFYCHFFLGQNIIALGENCYGNNRGEWIRAWRFKPGMYVDSHEPPVMRYREGSIANAPLMTRAETKTHNLVFDHFSYSTEPQVQFKETFYRYRGAVRAWRRLQKNTRWPVRLKDFLPWVDDRAIADQLHK